MKKFPFAGGVAALLLLAPAAASAQAFVQAETGLDSAAMNGDPDHGLHYGFTAGYDLPLQGSLFVGVQGTASDSTAKGCETPNYVFEGLLLREAITSKTCVKAGRDLSADIRVGVALTPKFKIYGLAGYANARVRTTQRYDYDDSADVSSARNLDGFRLGGGIEYDLTKRFFAKAEYRYSNYESAVKRNDGVFALGAKF